jgi:ABC-type multidrug transport system fused ATPase/permease subunit
MFSGNYERLREQQMELDWLSERYRGYINMKYKGVMSLFMLVSVAAYSYINVFTEQSSGGSSGLALLIQYTIQLSNYLLYFTMSIWEIKGQAVSIERVKPYLTTKPSVAARITAADNVIAKLRKMPEEGTDRTKLQ